MRSYATSVASPAPAAASPAPAAAYATSVCGLTCASRGALQLACSTSLDRERAHAQARERPARKRERHLRQPRRTPVCSHLVASEREREIH